MDARTRNANKQAEGRQELPTDPGAEMKLPKGEDEVLGAIAGVEHQLTALRKAHSEHRQAMMDLADKRRELAEASENLRVRQRQVEARGEEIEGREGELTAREVELAEMRQEVEGRGSEVASRAARVEQRESKIAQQAETLERREAQVESRGEEIESVAVGLKRDRQRLEMTARELQERSGTLASRTAEMEDREQVLLEREAAADEKLSRENGAEVRLAEAEKSLRLVEGRLKGRELELGERSRAFEDMAARAGMLEADLNTTRGQLESALRQTEEKLARERKVSEGLRAQMEVAEEDVRNAGGAVRRVGELEALLASASEEMERVRAEAHAGVEAELTAAAGLVTELEGERGRVSALEAELGAAQREVEALRARADGLAASADEQVTEYRLRAEADALRASELEGRLASAEAGLTEAARARDAARQELVSAGENSAEADRLRDGLTAAVERLAEAEREAASAGEALGALRDETEGRIASLLGEVEMKSTALARVEQAALEMEGEGRDLRAKIEELEIELEVVNAKPRPNADEFQRSRRRRLIRQRKMVRDQSGKVRRATEALRDRLNECETVLQKRAELAEAFHAIVEMRQKNAKREVRGGVVFGVIGMMAVLGMMGAVSWFVAGRVSPGEYAATVVINGHAGPRQTLEEADALAWRAYMEGLTTDPRFLEQAAERMQRRGIAALGTAGELGREIKERLTIDSPTPDEIRLEWRGEGADRSRRVLDTYAVTLASVSNQARVRRSDGVTTDIPHDAVASGEPLDNDRVETAGIIFGGSTGLTMLMGGLIWRRLSAAKARFDRDVRIDPLLDDSRWQMPSRG